MRWPLKYGMRSWNWTPMKNYEGDGRSSCLRKNRGFLQISSHFAQILVIVEDAGCSSQREVAGCSTRRADASCRCEEGALPDVAIPSEEGVLPDEVEAYLSSSPKMPSAFLS